MVILFRIDDRLVHAQVLLGWGRTLHPDRIVLADDGVSATDWERDLYVAAGEPDFKVTVLSERDASQQIAGGVFESERIFLLVRGPREALCLLEGGVDAGEINVGGMEPRQGRERITENVHVDADEKAVLREIVKRGITLETRALPGDQRVTINSRVV